MKIIIAGDTHGYFGELNFLIESEEPDVIIICGDFGYWPEEYILNTSYSGERIITGKPFNVSAIKNPKTAIYWIPGNHEQWDDLERNYGRTGLEPIEMIPGCNVFYCPIGSTKKINDINFLFVGGASSQDKKYRTERYDWFPQEDLTFDDYDFIEANVKDKIDCVISHTCPRDFAVRIDYPDKFSDPNRYILNKILHHYHPEDWCFGHWHNFETGKYKNTSWTMLDHNTSGRKWWVIIE